MAKIDRSTDRSRSIRFDSIRLDSIRFDRQTTGTEEGKLKRVSELLLLLLLLSRARSLQRRRRRRRRRRRLLCAIGASVCGELRRRRGEFGEKPPGRR
jgi:hypothetical protein